MSTHDSCQVLRHSHSPRPLQSFACRRVVPRHVFLVGTLCAALMGFLCGCPIAASSPEFTEGFMAADGVVQREIEEADIVKVADGYLYVANPYTGLRIVDVRDAEQPALKGRLPLGGRAVELFVRDELAYVLTAADFLYCAGQTIGFAEGIFDPQVVPDFRGSRLWIVDVADKDAPAVLSTVDIDGFVTASRRVGDVIYAAGNGLFGDLGNGEDAEEAEDTPSGGFSSASAFVTSVSIAEPASAAVIETEVFPGRSLDILVGPDVLYVFGNDSAVFDTSIVTYVDISDPAGEIVIRDQIRVPGTVEDRSSIDVHDGTLRVVTEEFIPSVFTTVVALYVFDVGDPDDIVRLARLPIITDRSLRAARFDGERAYIVTSFFDAPLSVLDLSDPAAPQLAGSLDLPSVSTQLHPLGDRLLGVGFDTSEGVRPALTLYDVSDPARPVVLSKLVVGERLTFSTRSTATVDEEALRIVPDAGLILLPISEFDRDTGLFADSVLFVKMNERSLQDRGAIGHVGPVRRADLLHQHVWMLSDHAFQMVNIGNLDGPASLALLQFISEQELLDAGLSGCANAARDRGTRIEILPAGCGGFGPLLLILLPLCLGTLRLIKPRPGALTRPES